MAGQEQNFKDYWAAYDGPRKAEARKAIDLMTEEEYQQFLQALFPARDSYQHAESLDTGELGYIDLWD